MENLRAYEAILWDFDGVLMNSMPVRDKGFEVVLKEHPAELVEKLMAYHRRNGGLSRYVKFRYFYEEILGKSITEEEVNQLAARFSDVMMELLIDKTLLILDSLDFVMREHENVPMHIVSGSDGKELNQICERLDIAKYFISIHGSPTPKKKLVADLLEKHGYNPEKTVLIGDSINDHEAAVVNNIAFIGYNNPALEEELKCAYISTFQHA